MNNRQAALIAAVSSIELSKFPHETHYYERVANRASAFEGMLNKADQDGKWVEVEIDYGSPQIF